MSLTLEQRIRVASHAAARYALTAPLPDLDKTEIGLMTLDEFLGYRNPQEKHHAPDSYTFTLESLNRDYSVHPVGAHGSSHKRFITYKSQRPGDFLIKIDRGPYQDLVAVLHLGVMYYSPVLHRNEVPDYYLSNQGKIVPLEIRQVKLVKYIGEYVSLVSNTAKRNQEEYPYLHQHIRVMKEYMEIRFKKKPEKDKGTAIAILNSSGQIVARATDEWGATLLGVAREYRSRGLGKIIGKVWYEWNPGYPSGGFTGTGEANAIALWKDRVREFLSFGWYSTLVRERKLSRSKVKAILADLGERSMPRALPEAKVKPIHTLVMIEPGAFYVYDEAFYDEQDDRFLYAFGFFRDSGDKTFLFRLDYDRKFHKLATNVALQMARNEGKDLYDGPGYGDVLELRGIDHLAREGDYIRLTKDVLDLVPLRNRELRVRRTRDRYNETKHLIMEMSESKSWG